MVRDLVTDVSFNFEMAKGVPPFQPAFEPKPAHPDGRHRVQQREVEEKVVSRRYDPVTMLRRKIRGQR